MADVDDDVGSKCVSSDLELVIGVNNKTCGSDRLSLMMAACVPRGDNVVGFPTWDITEYRVFYFIKMDPLKAFFFLNKK